MYCPRCAAQNLDDAKFCRACGADIRLVPQALMGSLPAGIKQSVEDKGKREKKEKKREPATIDAGLKNIFKGFAFLFIVLLGFYVFRGAFWLTIWFIIPALESVGQGIGQLIRSQQEQARLPGPRADESERALFVPPAPVARPLASADTAEMVNTTTIAPPPSVTEMTTRHLGDAPRKAS